MNAGRHFFQNMPQKSSERCQTCTLQDLVDVDAITSNDVGAILATLGVEAARATVVAEVVKVRCRSPSMARGA